MIINRITTINLPVEKTGFDYVQRSWRIIALAFLNTLEREHTNDTKRQRYAVKDDKGQEVDKPSIWVACLSAYNSGYFMELGLYQSNQEELLEQIQEVRKVHGFHIYD